MTTTLTLAPSQQQSVFDLTVSLAPHSDEEIRAALAKSYLANDKMPRETTKYSQQTEREIERTAAWMNKLTPLADRVAAAIEAGKLAERPLVDIVSTCPQGQTIAEREAMFAAMKGEAVRSKSKRVAVVSVEMGGTAA